jgi:hypothetical protein
MRSRRPIDVDEDGRLVVGAQRRAVSSSCEYSGASGGIRSAGRKGRWEPRSSLGTFPVRFPTDDEDTRDTGWHIDASFPGSDSVSDDYLTWRINIHSRGRALLLLFLFSDVGKDDAPTRIRVGSHFGGSPNAGARWRGGTSSNVCRLRRHIRLPVGHGDRSGGYCLPLSSISGARSPGQPWSWAAFHGSAATVRARAFLL